MGEENPRAALEREMILSALAQTDGNYSQAAARLKMSRTTLWRKMKQHRLVEGEKVVQNETIVNG
jgi:transcriptional regulator of acetoin/glycerol metabolism